MNMSKNWMSSRMLDSKLNEDITARALGLPSRIAIAGSIAESESATTRKTTIKKSVAASEAACMTGTHNASSNYIYIMNFRQYFNQIWSDSLILAKNYLQTASFISWPVF